MTTIIDKTKPPAPRWTYKPLPDFKTKIERVRYRELWQQRYTEGYGGLTGMHLMYLQEGHLKLIDGQIIRPDWREDDERYFFIPVHECRSGENVMSLLISKRREWGLTSMGSFIPHYDARITKGVTCNITSDSQGHLYKLFMDKIMTFQDHFHPDIRGSYDSKQGGSISRTKSKVGMTLAVKSKNEWGEEIMINTEFFCNESSESDLAVSKFSSTRSHFTFVDEAALHKRLVQLLVALQPVLTKGTKQRGFLLLGGSVEDSISQACLVRLKSLIDTPETYNLRHVFVPGYAALDEYTVNGYSDEKGAIEWILKKRELLDKNRDKTALNGFIKSHPLTIEELFDAGGEGFWEEESFKILNQNARELEVKKPPITPVELVNMGGQVKVNAVSKSPITILEHPKDRVKYIIGVDSIMSGTEAGDEKGSEFAAIVMKQLDRDDDTLPDEEKTSYTPVALYHERPKKLVGGAYAQLISLAHYYNMFGSINDIVCKIFPEANAATTEHLITDLDAKGMKDFLMSRPDLSGKGNSDTSKKGVYVTVDVLDWQTKQANAFVQKYWYRNRMLEVTMSLLKLGAQNEDIGSAFLAALVGMGSRFDKSPDPPSPPPPRWRHTISADGANEWIQVNAERNENKKPKTILFMGIETVVKGVDNE